MIEYVARMLRSTDTLPAADPASVVSSADLGDVLWSGAAFLETTTGTAYVHHAWALSLVLAIAAVLTLILWTLSRKGQDENGTGRIVVPAALGAVVFVLFGGLSLLSLPEVHEKAHTVYAITPTRIVKFTRGGGRVDIPASAISTVSLSDEGKVLIQLNRGTVEIETMDKARMRAALDTLVKTAGHGTNAIRETLG